MPGRAKLQDIADACGVSSATVSRILNRDSRFSVRPDVRKKVHETALRLGYVPDLSARNLNRRQTRIAGIFSSPFTHFGMGVNEGILDGVCQVLHSSQYDVFYDVAPRWREGASVPFWRFDGAVLLQSPRPEVVKELDRRQVPYVCVNENVGKPVSAVLADDVQGMKTAVEHLASLGHRRIAYANSFADYFAHHSIADRHETLLKHARRHSAAITAGHEEPFSNASGFLQRAKREKATAIIAYDHRIAVSLLGRSQAMGIAIPHDLSLMCFNDEFPLAELHPGITCIAVAGKTMGQIAAASLLQAIQGARTAEVTVIKVPETLTVRGSTGPAA